MTENEKRKMQLTPELEAMVEELANARAAERQAKDRATQVRARIREELETAQAQVGLAASGAPVVEISVSSRSKVNAKRLQALHPDVYEDVIEQKEIVNVRLV